MFSLTWSPTKYISPKLFYKWKHNNAKTSLKQLFLFIVFFLFSNFGIFPINFIVRILKRKTVNHFRQLNQVACLETIKIPIKCILWNLWIILFQFQISSASSQAKARGWLTEKRFGLCVSFSKTCYVLNVFRYFKCFDVLFKPAMFLSIPSLKSFVFCFFSKPGTF